MYRLTALVYAEVEFWSTARKLKPIDGSDEIRIARVEPNKDAYFQVFFAK